MIETIRLAFAGVERGAITLHEAEVIDGYGDDAERARARHQDNESSWESVPDKSIAECAWALPHLDPASWRYYIPARMIWAIRFGHADGSVVTDFTIYSFDGGSEPDDYHLQRFRTLTPAQCTAVCRFLRYMASTHECDSGVARRALCDYWGRFGGTS